MLGQEEPKSAILHPFEWEPGPKPSAMPHLGQGQSAEFQSWELYWRSQLPQWHRAGNQTASVEMPAGLQMVVTPSRRDKWRE